MKAAHDELIQTGFLNKVVWRKSKTEERKWITTYHFGERASAELQRGFVDETCLPALLAVETAEMAGILEKPITPDENKGQGERSARKQKQAGGELSGIAQQLYEHGLTQSVAIGFAKDFSQEYLLEKIALHDAMKRGKYERSY